MVLQAAERIEGEVHPLDAGNHRAGARNPPHHRHADRQGLQMEGMISYRRGKIRIRNAKDSNGSVRLLQRAEPGVLAAERLKGPESGETQTSVC